MRFPAKQRVGKLHLERRQIHPNSSNGKAGTDKRQRTEAVVEREEFESRKSRSHAHFGLGMKLTEDKNGRAVIQSNLADAIDNKANKSEADKKLRSTIMEYYRSPNMKKNELIRQTEVVDKNRRHCGIAQEDVRNRLNQLNELKSRYTAVIIELNSLGSISNRAVKLLNLVCDKISETEKALPGAGEDCHLQRMSHIARMELSAQLLRS